MSIVVVAGMLAWTIYITLLGALAMLALPARASGGPRWLALLASVAGLALGMVAAVEYVRQTEPLVQVVRVAWVPALGIEYHLAADGISLTLVVLTGLAAVAGVLFSWNIQDRPREFFLLYLTLIAGVYGVFLSFDLFLLFVFYELAIIPKYFLIAIWGSTRREYGAMKLVLYSFVGSAMVLVGILAAGAVASAQSGQITFSLPALAKVTFTPGFQGWAFPLVFVGFAILAGLWPFHTWAPTGHVAAPTAASMLLAGVVMKLGAYGALRVAVALFPQGLQAWHRELAILAALGILLGALAALAQKDFKFVIGYSSVSHMGFVLLGLLTLHRVGMEGAVLQMFSHGVIAGLLFAVVGRMVYDRTHSRELDLLERWDLARALPFAAVTFVLAAMASMGLPGFSGFVAEISVLIGAWHAFPLAVLTAGVGIVLGVAYSLRALQKAFLAGPDVAPGGPARPLEPISLPEKAGACLLLAATVAVGLFPQLLLRLIAPSWESVLFQQFRREAGW